MAVKEEPINPAPELLINLIRKCSLPPQVQRKIRVQMAEQDVSYHVRTASIQEKGDLLATNLSGPGSRDVTMRAYPCLDSLLSCRRVRSQENNATSMLAGDLFHEMRVRTQCIGGLAINCEIDQRRSSEDVSLLFPEGFQVPVDLCDINRHPTHQILNFRHV